MSHVKIIIGFVFFFTSCRTQERIQYSGRTEKTKDGIVKIYWPGTSVTARFKGSSLKATLKDERGRNHYAVIIDNDSVYTFKTDTSLKTYTLAENLAHDEHTITLYRLMDWFEGSTEFHGFEFEQGVKPLPISKSKRRIEFYGNSITVGAGMNERETVRRDVSTNNYKSYGSIVARHYNAEYSCVASSGIGLMISWGSLIMPEIYDRLNPADSNSRWSFAGKHPDIVVVNLLQNDNSLWNKKDHEQFIRRFGTMAPEEEELVDRYKNFVARLRSHYPNSHIICALGSMDAVRPGSPWPGYIEKAVSMLNDKKIYTLFFDHINGGGHPNAAEHQQMADKLIRFIDSNIKW